MQYRSQPGNLVPTLLCICVFDHRKSSKAKELPNTEKTSDQFYFRTGNQILKLIAAILVLQVQCPLRA